MARNAETPRTYTVSRAAREPLVRFMCEALEAEGCRIINSSDPSLAPFRIAFETRTGERMGVVAYAFLATFTPTKNRPLDEHTFQVKYGSKKDSSLHPLWFDPYGLYTTIFCGINPELGLFVGADPEMHNPTKLFIRVEFKQRHVDAILKDGWHAWEREHRKGSAVAPVEVLVGGRASSFLRFVRFEREAQGLDQGHRQLLAEKMPAIVVPAGELATMGRAAGVPKRVRHQLAQELQLSEQEVMDLIAQHRRLKMAVRGWVAEEHLVRHLQTVAGVSECRRLDEDGGPDVSLRYQESRPLLVECKNVLREKTANGLARVDFQKTRSSKGDPCSRFYRPDQFDVVAACLHSISERWEYRYVLPGLLPPHRACPGKIATAVRVDDKWTSSAAEILAQAAAS
jgi:hypothetical protein